MNFRDLHYADEPLLLPNAWDVPSALAFCDAGYPAIGTTSFGLAASAGYPDGGRANIYDYYDGAGPNVAETMAGSVRGDAAAIREVITAYEDLGADELIFNPGVSDLGEIGRLAELVL